MVLMTLDVLKDCEYIELELSKFPNNKTVIKFKIEENKEFKLFTDNTNVSSLLQSLL